jgi:Tfp pilus assembly protein FimV
MIAFLETFFKHHLAWVVLVVVGLVGIHYWQAEHDARAKAEATVKVDETQVATLQQAITQNNQSIAALQTQMAARDQQNATIIASLANAKQQAVTTPQQVTVLATEAKLPQPITSIADSSDWRLPQADVEPLFSQVNTGLQAQANLTTCQADLTDEKTLAATQAKTISDETQQIALKDNEIVALKKKPSFFKRIGSTMKAVGVGIGIGILVVVH